MTRREVIGRYRGSVMGLAWSFFNPILMLAIYTFVFSVIFQARWGLEEESKADFAIVLFVGMIVHGFFAECINRAPGLILTNVNYVKKVVFPLEILPLVAMATALFHTVASLIVLLTAKMIAHLYVPWTAVLFPVVILPFLFLTAGVAWGLAATGVYVRDVGQVTGILITALLFLSPIFYPASSLPEEYQYLLLINPLTFVIEESRNVLIWGHLPNWSGFANYCVISAVVAWVGFWWFQKTRKGFADVL